MIAIHHICICTYNMYIISNIHIICTYVYKCAYIYNYIYIIIYIKLYIYNYIYIYMHTIVHIHISLVFPESLQGVALPLSGIVTLCPTNHSQVSFGEMHVAGDVSQAIAHTHSPASRI